MSCQVTYALNPYPELTLTLNPYVRSPHFGVAHAMCLGLAPWLAAEVPHLVETGAIAAKA